MSKERDMLARLYELVRELPAITREQVNSRNEALWIVSELLSKHKRED